MNIEQRISMNRFILYLVAFCFAPTCAGAASLYDSVKKGNDLYGQGKYDEAVTAFVDGQVENPENGKLKFNIASSKYMMKNYEEALNGFLDVAGGARDAGLEEKALFNAGNALYRQGKLEQAVEYYTRALQLDPNDKDAQHNLEFVREEIKRRINEAKNTEQQQKKEQNCQNPQQNKQPDNQTQSSSTEQNLQNDQQPQDQPNEQPQDQEDSSGQQAQSQAAPQDQQSGERSAQAPKDDSMSRDQAEQLLYGVRENRDNLKEGKRATAQPGARSGKDW